ncbi:MAG TPA: nucleotide disphospho-sugar-binding domain-containing protein [Candidatus Limnocylindrales bacterium]|nr:nucleotide disphospho-sugar-binding domain-containing protein [Candidatus Limnocylindrales bacterium]
MRVLFTMWPLPAHLYPTVPVAWALQGAGHEVCVASHPLMNDTITSLGLTAVALGDMQSMPSLAAIPDYLPDPRRREELAGLLGITEAEMSTWNMFSHYTIASIRIFHDVQGRDRVPGIDNLVDFARDWRPDLILWDLTWPSAAVAARLSGAAHARLLWGPDYCSWGHELFSGRGSGLDDPLVAAVAPVADRYGLELDDELMFGQWTVDPTPPAVRLAQTSRVARTVSVRRVPYAGAGVLPDWLYPVPKRPRIALSVGATARRFENPNTLMISSLFEMLSELDIEVVATLTDGEIAGQPIPDNVRTIDYMPLTQLLPTCSAIVHHGGGGTMAAAVAQRLPQLILQGEGLEAVAYSRYLTAMNGGLLINYREQSVGQMRKRLLAVLNDPQYRQGAQALYADWLSLPSPNDIVPMLEKLTAQFR